jgi:hypothetical protein
VNDKLVNVSTIDYGLNEFFDKAKAYIKMKSNDSENGKSYNACVYRAQDTENELKSCMRK